MAEPFSAIIESARKALESSLAETLASESSESSITQFGPGDQLEAIKGSSVEGLRLQNTEMLNSLKQTPASSETGPLEQLKPAEVGKPIESYNEEVRQYSSAGEIRVTEAKKWEKVPLSESKETRTDWLMNKPEYIKQWQDMNGRPWPTYESDYAENGTIIRKEGDLYDAHHVQPLEFGGKNSAENITPMHAKDHMDHKGIHRPDGPYAELARHFRTV